MSKRLEQPVTFEKGLLEYEESSVTPVGWAAELQNWVAEPTGGVRARAAWSKGSTSGLPATRRNRGIGTFTRTTDPTIAQVSTVYTARAIGASVTPTMTWGVPTQVGATIVAFIGWHNESSTVATTVTPVAPATGWTVRQALPASPAVQVPYTAVYDLATVASYAGTVAPFTISTVNSKTFSITMFLVELGGVSSFDVKANNSGSNINAANSPLTVTTTTATTTQASELQLSWTYTTRTGPASGGETFTYSSPLAGWATQYEQTTYVGLATVGFWKSRGILHQKTVTATGTVSQTLSTSFTNLSNDTNRMDMTVLTYKGWNDDAVPAARRDFLLAANDDGTNIDIWRVDRANLNSATYSLIDSNVALSASAPIAFAIGLGKAWYTGSGFAELRGYDGSLASAVTGSPAGAKCLTIHKERLWAASGTRLSYSQVGDGSTWTGRGSSYFDIGREDGEDIEDIAVFANGLLIAKKTGLWFLVGDTPAQFQVIKLVGGGGAQGRSICSTPFGCAIAGTDQVWQFDGTTVEPITKGVQTSYGIAEGAYVSTSYIDDNLYIATSSKEFVFDMSAKTWRIEQVSNGTDGEQPAMLFNYRDVQYMGPAAGTTMSLLNFRTFPNPARGGDEGLSTSYVLSTGDLWLAGPGHTMTVQNMNTQVRQRGDGSTGLDLAVTYDDGSSDETRTIEARDVDNTLGYLVFREWLQRTGKSGVSSVKLRFTQTLPSTDDCAFDIESLLLSFDQEDH